MINRKLGGVICDNTGITNVPSDVFMHQSSESFVDCRQVGKLDGNVIEELLIGGSLMETTAESKTTRTHTTTLITPTLSTVTKDSSESKCDHWASQGYCTHTFASWMIVNCREACGSKIKP